MNREQFVSLNTITNNTRLSQWLSFNAAAAADDDDDDAYTVDAGTAAERNRQWLYITSTLSDAAAR